MVIRLTEDLEAALTEQAKRRGVSAENVALDALRDQFLENAGAHRPQDEWERKLFDAALDCEVSVPDWVLSSEGLCE